MTERNQKSHSVKKSDAIKQLAGDLANLDSDIKALSESKGDEEMLSLIVEEANKGIDISRRYPTFYKKLLNYPDLMQAFIDVLESFDDEDENLPIPWNMEASTKLDFLSDGIPKPVIEMFGNNWKINWQRTINQLQTILSPSEFAYRLDYTISEDPWFVLLRDEVEIDGSLYAIALECAFSGEDKEAFTPFLDIAVTVGGTARRSRFPIQSSLQWGTYKETIQIQAEGRAKFPNISLATMFDKEYENVNAELSLIIEPVL